MITIGTVIGHERENEYHQMSLETVFKYCKHVKEIVICLAYGPKDFYEEKVVSGIKIVKFYYPSTNQYLFNKWENDRPRPLCDLGLEECARRANEKYVMLLDPDTILLSPIDELYLNLINKYDIAYIGISHHIAIHYACGYFPTNANIMMKKSDLPPVGWYGNPDGLGYFWGHHHLNDAKWKEKFPKPDGLYDTGVFLYPWVMENNMRWMGFPTGDAHLYTTQYVRSNFVIDKVPKQPLLWHATGGYSETQSFWGNFKDEYAKFKNGEDD